MAQPAEQQKGSVKEKTASGRNVGGITLNASNVLLVRAALFFPTIGLVFAAWLGTGAEANCGTSTKTVLCYLPGVEWMPIVYAISFCAIVVGYILIKNVNK